MSKLSLTAIVPAYNAATNLPTCIEALLAQKLDLPLEIIVVDDGSTDTTHEIAKSYEKRGVKLLSLTHAGAGAARNAGIVQSHGDLLLFTDADCAPAPDWAAQFQQAFTSEPALAAAKGVYRTRQTGAVARFVQAEYADRYKRMARASQIDFVDTYAAAYRREVLQDESFDPRYPGAIVEDAELAYRLAKRGLLMKFVPNAIVYHQHADTVSKYFRRKFKIGFWRVAVYRQHPEKLKSDSHTPQVAKLQMLLMTLGISTALFDFGLKMLGKPKTASLCKRTSIVTLAVFFITTAPFVARTQQTDKKAAFVAPLMLSVRATALASGAIAGLFNLALASFSNQINS